MTGARPPRALPPTAPGRQRGVSGPSRDDTNAEAAAVGSQAPVSGPDPKPAASHPKPAASHPKPAASHPKPAASHPKPAASHPKPAASHPKPAASHPKPAASHPKPAASHPKPAASHPKPAASHRESPDTRPGHAAPRSGCSGTRSGRSVIRDGPAGRKAPGRRCRRASRPPAPPVPAKPATPASGAPQPPAPGQPRRPAPSVERALSGPAADRIDGWQRRVRVVPGGQGPGKRDQETLDQDRARLPLAGPRRIVFLGCTSGAGQTMTALMTGQLLVALRGDPVAALDLNPGHGSLTRQAQASPALTVAALLADAPADVVPGSTVSATTVPSSTVPASTVPASTGHSPWTRFDIITSDADPAAPGERDYARLAERAGRLYPLMVIDPGASEVTRVLGVADQLVLVAPASADASRSLAMTQEWLGHNGHRELAAGAVTVVNGVSRASLSDVEQAEAVARGRCRAIVRIPWDDGLAGGGPQAAGSAGPAAKVSSLRPQARHAYTALAGVLVAGLAAAPVPRKVPH